MTTSSPFMDDYSSEEYSSDDYEDFDGYCCILPKAGTPKIHGGLPDVNTCVESALEAAENNVVVEADAMTEESSEAVEADADAAFEHGDAMIEEYYANNAVEADDGREAELAVGEELEAAQESDSKAVEANSLAEPEEDAVEVFLKTVELEEDVAVELEIVVDAMTQEFSEAVEADHAALEDGDAIIEAVEAAVALAQVISVVGMIEEFSEEADAAIETTVDAMLEESRADVVLALELPFDAMIEAPPVIDKHDYTSEGDESEGDYSAEGDASEDYSSDLDASEDYSSEGDAISMSLDNSVEFEDYCVKVKIDIEDYNSSEVDTIQDYSIEGDASEDYSSNLDANEDYSSEGDAISMSSDDLVQFKDYCVGVEIDINDYNSSEVNTIEDYSEGGDVIDEFSFQGGDGSEDSFSKDSVEFEDYCFGGEIDHVIEGYDSSKLDLIEDYLSGDVINKYFSEGDAISKEKWFSQDFDEETTILVQAILDFSTIPPLFYLPDYLSVLKSSINSFFHLCSYISALICKEPITNKNA